MEGITKSRQCIRCSEGRIAALVIAALVACALMAVPQAFASDGKLSTGSSSSALGPMAYTGKYNCDYAVYKADGYLYRSDSAGNALANGNVWGEDNTDANGSLKTVTNLFIDANVTDASSIKVKNAKGSDLTAHFYTNSIGSSSSPASYTLPNLQRVVFKLNSSGKNSIKNLPTYAFRNDRFLEQVVNLDKTQLASIPKYAFEGCEAIVGLSIPDTALTIEDYAFRGCKGMSSIQFGSSSRLQSIRSHAFYNCSMLGNSTSLVLPADLREIDGYAFYNCQVLKTIVLLGTAHTTDINGKTTFQNSGLKAVYVANRFVSAYKASDSMKAWKGSNYDYASLVHGWLEASTTESTPYTGSKITPAVKVTWMGSGLSASNYTTTYSNNTNVGTATVTVTGKGAYSATATTTFKILSRNISQATISGIVSKSYTGKAQTQNIVVTLGGRTLSASADYLVTYSGNTNAGTAKVTISGKGNYTGAVTKTFTIKAIAISKAKISGIKNKTYNGSAIKQAGLKVKLNGKQLVAGKDYTVSYSSNKKAGTAKVKIKGKGNLTGSTTKTFTIKKRSIKKAHLSLSSTSYTYNGSKRIPTVKIAGDKKLKAGVDYKLKYSNAKSKNAGTYTVRAVGIGSCTGTSAIASYRIKKAANPMSATIGSARFNYNGTSSQTISASKAFNVSNAKGAVTFRKTSGNPKIMVSKSGKVTILKGLKRGIYSFTVKITALGDKNYQSKTVTLTPALTLGYRR